MMTSSLTHMTVLDCILNLLSTKQNLSEECYLAGVDVLKTIALNSDSRTFLLKSNFIQKLPELLSKTFKLKHYGRLEAILDVLINMSFTADGQMGLIRLSGNYFIFYFLI